MSQLLLPEKSQSLKSPKSSHEELSVIACAHPFKTQKTTLAVPYGLTVSEILRTLQPRSELARHAVVFVDDNLIDPREWHFSRPPIGAKLYIRIVPMGGGGGGGKNPLAMVLSLAVVFAAVWAGPAFAGMLGYEAASTAFTVASGFGTAAVGMAGSLLVSAIAPPSMPSLSPMSGISSLNSRSPTAFINGAKNELRPFGVVPRVLGTFKMFPPLGAPVYTEIVGDEQYLRMLVVWGHGPLEIPLDSLKIGDTPLNTIKDYEIETRYGYPDDKPLTLFPKQVIEESLSWELKIGEDWYYKRTRRDVDEISVDITLPDGLAQKEFFESGEGDGNPTWGDRIASASVRVVIRYREVGAKDWIFAPELKVNALQKTALRRGGWWRVPRGQYDVGLKRIRVGARPPKIGKVVWTAIRSISAEDPVSMKGVAKSALRFKATGELQGIVDSLNGIPTSILPDWDRRSRRWISRKTSNPASIYREILQGPANARAIGDNRLSIPEIEHWHEVNEREGREFNMIVDFQTTVHQILRDVAAAGRARPGRRDGRVSVLVDEPKSIPSQHFSPKNSWGFEGTKNFEKIPHGLKVRFLNREKGWQNDQLLVYRPGYSPKTATDFEGLELLGVTDPDQIRRDALYHFQTALLRPETYSFTTNVSSLVCGRGDLIYVQHDVSLWGLGSAWVKAVSDDGAGMATGVELDDFLEMQADKTYELRFRLTDRPQLLAAVQTQPGEHNILIFKNPINLADAPRPGDFAQFGETGLSAAELIIKDILPGPGLTAQLICVDAAPRVHMRWAGSSATGRFDPQISLPAGALKPSITGIQSGEGVLEKTRSGTVNIKMVVILGFVFHRQTDLTAIELRYRLEGAGNDWTKKTFSPDATSLSVRDLVELETYEIQARFIKPGGFGAWSQRVTHRVIGASAPPPDIDGLYLEGERIRWVYPLVPVDFSGFEVRYREGRSGFWDDATRAHTGRITATEFDISGIPGGIKVIMVRAFDRSGNPSPNFAAIIRNLGDPLVLNIINTIDYAALGYPGAIINGTVDGSTLNAASEGTPVWTGDHLPIWSQDGDPFWTEQFLEMIYDFNFKPAAENSDAKLTIEYGIEASQFALEYQTDSQARMFDGDGNPMWDGDGNPMWDPKPAFKPWPGVMTNLQMSKYFFRVRTSAGPIRGKIKKLEAVFDVPDESERFDDIIIASGGSRLPIIKSYRSIRNVSLTLRDDGNGANSIQIMDKNSALGPMVKATNSGANVSATIDATIQGVKGL